MNKYQWFSSEKSVQYMLVFSSVYFRLIYVGCDCTKQGFI